MKPITLVITESHHILLPHILVPSQTSSSVTLEDGRKLFLPTSIHSSKIVEPTIIGEWVIASGIKVQPVQDLTGLLPSDYTELSPGDSPGYLMFLNALIPGNASLLLTYDTTQQIRWVLPKWGVRTNNVQKITGLFAVPAGFNIKFAILPRDIDQPFCIDLETNSIKVPQVRKE